MEVTALSGKESTVYVQLLGEGTVCYRPTVAVEISSGIFQLLSTDDYDEDDEVWEFKPGAFVRCSMIKVSQGEIFAAVELQ